MRSPFAIFRKHQKLMTVILTGLAMFAFVILGAVQDPSNMPTGLIVIFVACTLGAIGWIAGIRSKKSNEFGTIGLILGAVLAVGGTMLSGPPVVVKADSGSIDRQQLGYLQTEREMANAIIMQASYIARQKEQSQFIQPPQPFQYHPDPTKDIIVGELLRREADEMGLAVTDDSVNDYLAAITQNKLTREDLKQISTQMRLSYTDLYNILRDQLKARMAAQFMYQGTTLPPESYWEFYKKLNVKESISVVPIAVSNFVDESIEPSDAELQELFDANRENYPNTSNDGKLDEGRPGFRQPRRVQLAYVEAVYDEIEKTVPPPTEDEIEAFYEEHYKTVSGDELDSANDGSTDSEVGPALPEPDQPSDEDGPALPETDAPVEEDAAVEGDAAPTEEGDGEAAPASEGETESEEPAESEEGAALTQPSSIQPVAFFDDAEDEPETEAAEEETPAAETVVEETTSEAADSETEPASEDAEAGPASEETDSPPPPPLPEANQPADSAPEAPGPTETAPGEAPAVPQTTTPPDAPEAASKPEVRELDDQLRSEITDQILRERTGDRMQEVIDDAVSYMREIGLQTLDPEDYDTHLSHEEALDRLKAYADEHNLVFGQTPLLSQFELSESEEYPIGRAVDRMFSNPFDQTPVQDVATQAFTSRPQEIFTNAQSVVLTDTESRFAYWKIDDQEEYVPESLDDEGIREQVVEQWRELKAREAAQKRAVELAEQANGKDEDLSAILAGQTITGNEGSSSVSVVHPPSFSWMSKADPRMSPNPFMTPPPERTQLRTVPGRIADSFMETVFNELQPNEAGVAHSVDKDYFYVVKVIERTYGRSENLEAFREQFLKEQLFAPYQFSDYPKLAQGQLQQYRTDWSKELFEKHGVEIIEQEEPEPEPDGEFADLETESAYN